MARNRLLPMVFSTLISLSLVLSACGTPATPTQPPPQPTVPPQATAAVQPTQAPQPTALPPTVAPTQAPVATPTSAVQQGGSLVFGLQTEPVSLDPAEGVYIADQLVDMHVYDPLIWTDPQLNLEPGLATSWEMSPDGKDFTLKLRQGVKFQDGTPFNADAVKFALTRAAAGVAQPAAVAITIMTDYITTTVKDDYTVEVSFKSPKPTFLNDLSRAWMGIPSPTAVEKWGKDFSQHPVGTGPFVFKEWAAQDHITLTRNPDYNWAPDFATHKGPAYLDQVTFRFLPEAATRLTALQSGEAQVVEEPSYMEASKMANDPAYHLETFVAPGMPSHMMINVEKPPTDDILVRQAMIYAVDQEGLVKTAFFDMQQPVHNVLSPTTWGYDEQAASMYRYNPDKAKELLKQAGWADTDNDGILEKNGKKLSIEYPALPAYEEAYMELLAAYLKRVGFDVHLTTMDDAGIFTFANAGKHNIVNMGWISSDPSVLNIVYNSANIAQGSAFTRFKNADLDNALNSAAQELDPNKRMQDYVDAQRIIMQNALVIPLYSYSRVMLMQSVVQGWRFDPEGFPYLYEVSLKQ
jgi:peptide/nickel transport system substrate-binding protein